MKNEILDILSTQVNINKDIESRVEQLLECIKDNNVFHTLEEVMEWYNTKLEELQATVTPIYLKDCNDGWEYNNFNGNLEHKSNGFFKIIGVKIISSIRESGKGWNQPMIDQGTEASIVGLIKKKFKGIPHYLIDAKFEPGNYGKIQFSPTLQCTYDNLNQLHKGKKPLYHEYFECIKNQQNIIFEHWYPEDGGRFYLKRVKNMIIETNQEIKSSNSHIWLTMFQLKQLLKKDNLINAHLRSLISYL
tara:strand:- start:92 stop:832 length:741 start_codon:yes stop_codon:yes gene_type:complete